MADAKITHAGGLKLPEPKWLTLKALAERWTSMSGATYETSNLLGLADDMRLQISIHCPLVIPHIIKPRIKMTEVQYRTKLGIPAPGIFGINPSDIKRLLAGEVFAPDSVLPNSVLSFDRETSSVVLVPTADNTLKVENLIVTLEEIERFEQYYFQPEELAVPSEEMPDNRPWAHLIDSPNPKTSTLYKRDANRIWESLTDEEKKTWAREAMQRNGGNKTKTGRELGITGNGVKYILETKP